MLTRSAPRQIRQVHWSVGCAPITAVVKNCLFSPLLLKASKSSRSCFSTRCLGMHERCSKGVPAVWLPSPVDLWPTLTELGGPLFLVTAISGWTSAPGMIPRLHARTAECLAFALPIRARNCKKKYRPLLLGPYRKGIGAVI